MHNQQQTNKTPEEWCHEGDAFSEKGRYEEAIICYDKALAIDANFKWAWSGKGSALSDLGRHEEAMVCYDKLRNTQYDEAIACYDDTYTRTVCDPTVNNPWSNKNIGFSNLAQTAFDCFDQALSISSAIESSEESEEDALREIYIQTRIEQFMQTVIVNDKKNTNRYLRGRDAAGNTCLHWAAMNMDETMVQFLLEQCVDVYALGVNSQGQLAIDLLLQDFEKNRDIVCIIAQRMPFHLDVQQKVFNQAILQQCGQALFLPDPFNSIDNLTSNGLYESAGNFKYNATSFLEGVCCVQVNVIKTLQMSEFKMGIDTLLALAHDLIIKHNCIVTGAQLDIDMGALNDAMRILPVEWHQQLPVQVPKILSDAIEKCIAAEKTKFARERGIGTSCLGRYLQWLDCLIWLYDESLQQALAIGGKWLPPAQRDMLIQKADDFNAYLCKELNIIPQEIAIAKQALAKHTDEKVSDLRSRALKLLRQNEWSESCREDKIQEYKMFLNNRLDMLDRQTPFLCQLHSLPISVVNETPVPDDVPPPVSPRRQLHVRGNSNFFQPHRSESNSSTSPISTEANESSAELELEEFENEASSEGSDEEVSFGMK